MSRYLVLVFRVGVSLGFAFWACAKILFGYSEGMALSRAAFYGAAIFESVVALLVSGERYLLGCRLALGSAAVPCCLQFWGHRQTAGVQAASPGPKSHSCGS